MSFLTNPIHLLKKAVTRGPEVIGRDAITGLVTYEAWWKRGQVHRVGKPAVIHRDRTNGTIIICEEWCKRGQHHRAKGPAVIRRDATTGAVIYEAWWKRGQQHRDNGPAVILRDAATGIVTYEAWWQDGQKHRNNEEAVIRRDVKTGRATYEEDWNHGKLTGAYDLWWTIGTGGRDAKQRSPAKAVASALPALDFLHTAPTSTAIM